MEASNLFNPIPAGVLENQDTLGGGAICPGLMSNNYKCLRTMDRLFSKVGFKTMTVKVGCKCGCKCWL